MAGKSRAKLVLHKSVAEAHQDALHYYEHLPDPEYYDPSDHHLSDEWLHRMMTTKFAFWLKVYKDEELKDLQQEAYVLDLEFLQELETTEQYEKHGGKIIFDKEKILAIVRHGKIYYPGNAEWELVKYKFRVASFVWVTFVHTIYHIREAGKLFTATYTFLPHTHPLRQLLLPYMYGAHKNIARLQRTIINNKGVIALVAGLTSFSESMKKILKRTDIDLVSELEVKWPDHNQDSIKLWDIIYKNVDEYLDCFKIDANDKYVKKWLSYLGNNAHHKFFTSALSGESKLNLSTVVSYFIFNASVMHHSLGHIMNGTTDPRYVSGSIRKSTKNDLWSIISKKDECIMRFAVYASSTRDVYFLTEDFSHLCTNYKGQIILRSLTAQLRQFSNEIKNWNQNNKDLPRLLDPEFISTSYAQ